MKACHGLLCGQLYLLLAKLVLNKCGYKSKVVVVQDVAVKSLTVHLLNSAVVIVHNRYVHCTFITLLCQLNIKNVITVFCGFSGYWGLAKQLFL